MARIAERNNRSIYSYLFHQHQYSMFFELAVENLITDILDEHREESDEALDDLPINLPPFEKVDFDAEEFRPFGA